MTKDATMPALRRDLAFAYRLYEPAEKDGRVLVLLHGSGTDETVLVPLARQAAPASRLLAVRGRVLQEGSRRWFKRVTPTEFDQQGIRREARKFAAFLGAAGTALGFSPADAVVLGYSNGANLASSVMLLHPGLIRRAVLMRAMPVLHDVPAGDLAGSAVLVLSGAHDVTYGPYAPALSSLLQRHGARVESHVVPCGHEFGDPDAELIRNWLETERP